MRKSNRSLIDCTTCGAKIYTLMMWPNYADEKIASQIVEANWPEPPGATEKCPRCQSDVDTTKAYPYIPNFPPAFDNLKQAYSGFVPKWELQRDSFEENVAKFLSENSVEDCQEAFNSAEGKAWFRQRMFYRSATGFYRSLQLFLGYLTLERHSYRSWAAVTGYYSRFYFIQAFLNLLMSTYFNVEKMNHHVFIFFDGDKVVLLPRDILPRALSKGSHETWWGLMEALKSPSYPCDNLSFILSNLVFNPKQRQEVNYDYGYIGGGFPELNWFDSGWKQMLSHFNPHARADRDITDIDRFFGDRDPEDCDEGDFMGDEAQIIWCSLIGYLQMLKALDFKQSFVVTATIVALADVHIGQEYPNILQGIARSTSDCFARRF